MENPNFFFTAITLEEKRLIEEIRVSTENLNAIQVLIKNYNFNSSVVKKQSNLFGNPFNEDVVITPINLPKREYKKRENTVADRILEALELIGTGTANQVGDALSELYPTDFPLQKARDTAKFQLSKLNGKGNVKGEKIFGKNSFLYTYVMDKEIADLL